MLFPSTFRNSVQSAFGRFPDRVSLTLKRKKNVEQLDQMNLFQGVL